MPPMRPVVESGWLYLLSVVATTRHRRIVSRPPESAITSALREVIWTAGCGSLHPKWAACGRRNDDRKSTLQQPRSRSA